MFAYQCQLAWRSIKKNPILCLLMALSLASGIATAMISYAQHYALTRNPLVHKDHQLFMLQTDSWHLKEAYRGLPLNAMPDRLSYRDVVALQRSEIPLRKSAMVHTGGALSLPGSDLQPFLANARISMRDYFAMFELEFLWGSAWSQAADESFQAVVALSEDTNQRLFQGKNSIGKTLMFEGRLYRVIAVVKSQKETSNKIQDIDRSLSYPPDQLYFPFAVLAHHEISLWGGSFECPNDAHDYGSGYQARLQDSCVWLTYWVEFADTAHKTEYEQFIREYIAGQKAQGFYPRPMRFALSTVSQKLVINGYSSGFHLLMVKFGFGFLLVCTLNAIVMLLAKFLKDAPESGVRRALGASRMAIFLQHLLESAFVGLLGGCLGLLLTWLGLVLLRYGYTSLPAPNGVSVTNSDYMFVMDAYLLVMTITVAVAASLCAGLYPAWRICRTPAAFYLKLQ